MKLIWHLIRKDTRRLRLALILWAGLVATGVALALASLHVKAGTSWDLERALLALNLSWGVDLVVAYVLAAAVVLEDSPTESTGFWITRPIAGWRLLAAKVASVGAGWWACRCWFGCRGGCIVVTTGPRFGRRRSTWRCRKGAPPSRA